MKKNPGMEEMLRFASHFSECSSSSARNRAGKTASRSSHIVLLTIILTFSLNIHALMAAETADDTTLALEYPKAGFTIVLPEEYADTEGILEENGGAEVERGSGITVARLEYIAMSEDDYRKLNEKKVVFPWDALNLIKKTGNLFTVYGVDGGRDFSAINAYYDNILHDEYARELTTVGEYTYYLYEDPYVTLFGDLEEYEESVGPAFFAEYSGLREAVREALEQGDFSEPEPTYLETSGKIMAFETVDLEGNPVSSEELFGSHKITIVNVWASWCMPCIGELPELEKMNARIGDLDCAVVGVLLDGDEEEALREAKDILKKKGVTYTNLLPPENFGEFFAGGAIPATYFVNRDGEILGDEIRGAYIEQYEKRLMEYLSD